MAFFLFCESTVADLPLSFSELEELVSDKDKSVGDTKCA